MSPSPSTSLQGILDWSGFSASSTKVDCGWVHRRGIKGNSVASRVRGQNSHRDLPSAPWIDAVREAARLDVDGYRNDPSGVRASVVPLGRWATGIEERSVPLLRSTKDTVLVNGLTPHARVPSGETIRIQTSLIKRVSPLVLTLKTLVAIGRPPDEERWRPR